jgi:hypothetical protein
MKEQSFLHTGTFGDTIYGLSAVKLMGGGTVYIQLNGMNEVAWNAFGAVNAGVHAGRYTKADFNFLLPLLEHQSYIRQVDVWRNEPVDYDLSKHYKFTTGPKGWQGNQTECYAMVCGVDINQHKKQLLIDPWLDSVDPIKIPGKSVVINRTSRYLQGRDPENTTWHDWVHNNGLNDVAVFVGTPEEHAAFNREFNARVVYQPVSDMLEMARIIQGCEMFVGNQSLPLALAIGLGKTFWCESRQDWDSFKSPHGYGDVWFPRANGFYF